MQKRIYLLSTLLPTLGFLFATPALSAEADLVKAEKAVSYTHLDVYKRQLLAHSLAYGLPAS